MRFQYISKATAIALLDIVVPRQGEAHVESLISSAKRYDDTPWLGPEGVKIGALKKGCVIRYYIAGYAQDGGDVDRALARVSTR